MTDEFNLERFPKTDPGRRVTLPQTGGFRLVYFPPQGPPGQRLAHDSCTIGRISENGVAPDDSRISRIHARVTRADDGSLVIRDNDSKNGVFVNGLRITEKVLQTGDVIRCGDTILTFEAGQFARFRTEWSTSLALTMAEFEIAAAAASSAPVLLLGPTGAGKTRLAGLIAARSAHAKPFLQLNCATLPPGLIDAELFGATRGAFTGASGDRVGMIEAASGGTLFLDEIATLPVELQAKLLSVVERQMVRPIGATQERKVDVRFIAATNIAPQVAVAAGHLREDLLYRLGGHTIELPGLAMRRPDIAAIAIQTLGGADHRVMTPEFLEAILMAPWPGNVRELLNVLNTCKSHPIPLDYNLLPPALTRLIVARSENGGWNTPEEAASIESDEARPSREQLQLLLKQCDGNISAVARQLNKHRQQVQRWVRMYKLER